MIDSASIPNSESITPSGELRNKYRVLALLGQGGMSLVHIAVAHSPGGVQKLVVLKSIRPELMRSEKVRGMFLDEARLATRLSHPNVVQTYEVVLISGRPVIVMEYMEGQPFVSLLRKAREQGGLSLALFLYLLQEALLGLDYAHSLTDYDGHSLRLVHRDISPQNVFVTYDGNAKILDFGIAKALNNSTHTESGELKGKIRYMAPEQMHAAADLDGRADVFSAGVMLWEALAERRIWQDASDVEVIHAVVNAGIPRVSSVNPHVNPKLEAICMKALALHPSERWESAGHMQVALEEASAELGLRASRKDVSNLMKELFGETRTKLRASIDGRMKSPEGRLLDLSEGSDGLFVDELLVGAPEGTAQPFSGTRQSSVPQRRRALVLGSFALLGLVGLLGARRLSGDKPAAAVSVVAPRPRSPSAQTASAPVNAGLVSVSFAAEPRAAVLFLDGNRLASNPFQAMVAKDDQPHELRAEAPGYVTQTLSISTSASSNLDLTLLQVRADGASHYKPGLTPKRVAASSTPVATDLASTKKALCDPPYIIDDKGIRRMRAECL